MEAMQTMEQCNCNMICDNQSSENMVTEDNKKNKKTNDIICG